ncbi:AraC family transcriptional regulator [Aureibacillus halotolerans]|uniref:AraC family transcriptional regulator n=1 Tax=Aureibacillus halotolerans TaxID=1508390 RepID=A0A4R6TUP4_9BACI|nr:AraC family transcriptional regulator [Aureibacillus halotolerans]TDQ37468.1 AraC family transcriptional regulator [Aureibacillus halotolerans]
MTFEGDPLDQRSIDAFRLEEYKFPNIKTSFELYGMHIRKVSAGWEYPVHEHAMYEINLVTEGAQRFYVDGELYEQKQGDMMLIRPNVRHSSEGAGEEFTYFCLHFNLEDRWFLPFFQQSNQSFYPARASLVRQIRPFLDRLMAMIKQPSHQLAIYALMFEMLGALTTALSLQDKTSAVPGHTIQLAYDIAEQLEKYILVSETLHEQTSKRKGIVTRVAEELSFSESYIQKVFRQVYHLSPRQYVSMRKLNHCKTSLQHSQMSIEELSLVMGYRDVAHFSRQFKRWSGLSPSQYREIQKSQTTYPHGP